MSLTCSTSKSQHENALEKLCRICGEISSERNNKFFGIAEYKSDMDVAFNTKTIDDIPGVHPKQFCTKCKNIVKNCKKRNTVSKLTPITWSPHQLENCEACHLASVKTVGGRPKKDTHAGGRPKQIRTVDDILSLDSTKPIPDSVEKAMSHVLAIKLEQSKLLNKSVQFKTGGPQPLTLTPITVPRTESNRACKRSISNRSKQLKDIICLSSGDGNESFTTQTAHIVKTVDEVSRESIIQKLNTTTTIPAEHVAAMKATQNIPWNLLEEIRRWLATFNVKLSTTNKVREVAKEWVGKGLKYEYAPLLVKKKKKSEVKLIPWCYIYNLVGHIISRLNELQECNLLVTHNFIPADEIHVKIGGDMGGGSFKMTYQIANVNNPNKLDNTVIFSIFETKDSRANLRICLERFKAHISKLETLTWGIEQKKFKIFMFGDYEFLSSMYGISGAAGRHPCLWCEITSDDMQFPLSSRQDHMANERTLFNLRMHFDNFVNKCGQQLNLAKTVCNVMDNIFFDIPLNQVCLPGLHITLGIYLKIYCGIIERYCAEVDHLINEDNSYHELKKLQIELSELEERRDLLQGEIDWYTVLHTDNIALIKDYQINLDEVENIIAEKEILIGEKQQGASHDDMSGPCVKSLDNTLAEIGVERQAYYSNTFIGNHVHMLLKEVNICKLCDSVPRVVLAEVGETSIYRECITQFEKIKVLLTLYAKCDNIFNVARYLHDEEILEFKDDVFRFMSYLRVNFSYIRITPKLHMLEDHMFDFLFKWKTGCGLYGEQGVESAHNGINRMKHRYSNIKNDLDRLHYIMNQHLLSTHPKACVLKPKKKTRNLKRNAEL